MRVFSISVPVSRNSGILTWDPIINMSCLYEKCYISQKSILHTHTQRTLSLMKIVYMKLYCLYRVK